MTETVLAMAGFGHSGMTARVRTVAIDLSEEVPALFSVRLRAEKPYGATVAEEFSSQTVVPLDAPMPQPRTKADVSVAALLDFRRLDADWDGCGAKKPNFESIRFAREFVRKLTSDSRIPTPTLHANGNVLLFVNDHDSYGDIEFYDDSRIGYYICQGNREWSGEIAFGLGGRQLPGGFSEIGFKI